MVCGTRFPREQRCVLRASTKNRVGENPLDPHGNKAQMQDLDAGNRSLPSVSREVAQKDGITPATKVLEPATKVLVGPQYQSHVRG